MKPKRIETDSKNSSSTELEESLPPFPGTQGASFNEPLIFERSRPGRRGYSFASQETAVELPEKLQRKKMAELPEVSEPDVVRHYTRLSQWNFSIDTNFYPLGSCTMKYNPKINEEVANYTGFAHIHPYQDPTTAQGALELMARLQDALLAITGMEAITLQPAAGAQGELAGILMIRAYHESQGRSPKKVLIPDSAHGTNPASCNMAGYTTVPIRTSSEGIVTVEALEAILDDDVAALMLTNPNTLGIFEREICDLTTRVHAKGGLVYCDGANLNAIIGKCRFRDMGVDVLHMNLHKTFTTPHGGGGPGAGPVAVVKELEPFLPVPRIIPPHPPLNVRGGEGGIYSLDFDHPQSIGRLQSFYGNFGILVRAYNYICEMGAKGFEQVAERAVLNANYIRKRLEGVYELPYQSPSLHEIVFSDKKQSTSGVKTLHIAKRLIDYGFHPPTIYFPLIVAGALMIEPTETESKETLDLFCDAMLAIAEEAKSNPKLVQGAPHHTKTRALDEAKAARHPKLRYEFTNKQ